VASSSQPAEMRWWGWGESGHRPALSSHTLAYLRASLGLAGRPRPPVALQQVRLAPSRLSEPVADRLRALLGPTGVAIDHRERVLHAAGKGYPDLVRMRAGEPEGAPDAIIYPREHEQLRRVLEVCAAASIAVVPFGGGTSVVGGVAPLAGGHAAVVSLDTRELREVLELDRQSATVAVGAGIRAPALEAYLGSRRLTLGHFPQSYEYVSLGGCAATRSAGQASSGYGAIAEMVLGLRLAAPADEIDLPALPATAAGPGLRQTIVGSEGILGVISELRLRVREAPAERRYEGVFFENLAAGVQALRTLTREHAVPDVARLSDERETQVSLMLAGAGTLKGELARAYLGARGYRGGCLAILGFEGGREEVAARRRRARALVRGCGARSVGRAPGQAWLKGRFEAPYLRDDLLEHGVMVETLETAVQWSGLLGAHQRITDAIAAAMAAQGTPGIVMCHVSHLYESGASLYFTLIARQLEDDPVAQWRVVKQAAGDAILASGATITHHHAVGRDHRPWMEREVGAGGIRALKALKSELDPSGIMNPGKLLPES
jgi:alkyldihydroxyacetonephosphate synthase